jgi:hypothetical protein
MTSINHTRRRTLVFLSKKLLVTAAFILALFICSCASIINKNIVYKGPKYPPYKGELKVYWKDHGVPADPNRYVLIGTVSGRTAACGLKQAAFHKELHDWIKDEAAKAGGNGVIIYCGELGSVGECFCYGDIIHFK